MLLNPAAARGRAAAHLRRAVERFSLEIRRVESPERMALEARRAAAEGLERVLVAGGDGSVHHAARGLAGSDCALGLVPVGSANDLARALGAETDPLRAVERALEAPPRRIDLGRAGSVCFAGVLGLGIDGEVSRRVREGLRWLPSRLAFAWATVLCLTRFRAPAVRVEHDDGTFEGPALLVALANSPLFGGGMRIAPEARLDDGWLDLVIVEPVSTSTALCVFPRVYRGTHLAHPAVHHRRVRAARLYSEPRRTLWADGEPLCETRPEGTPVDLWPGGIAIVA